MGGYTQTTIRDSKGNIIGYMPVTESTPYVPGGITDTSKSLYNQKIQQYDEQHFATLNTNPTASQTFNPQYKVTPNILEGGATGIYQQVQQIGGAQNPYVAQKFVQSFQEQSIPKPSLIGLSNEALGRSTIPLRDNSISQQVGGGDGSVIPQNSPVISPYNPFKQPPTLLDYRQGVSQQTPLISTPPQQPLPSQKMIGGIGLVDDLITHAMYKPNPTLSLSPLTRDPIMDRGINVTSSWWTDINKTRPTLQTENNISPLGYQNTSSYQNEVSALLTNPNASLDNIDLYNFTQTKKKPTPIGSFGSKSKKQCNKHSKKKKELKQISESDILKEIGVSDKPKSKTRMKTKKKKQGKKPMFWGI